ncbi:phage holin family protein [Planosporangium sp. 12N6]|uniref:phage holin family protein n=1 Tax=Planosporangium spinosum TaxID=3402278 RepID=UPI003CEB5E67
MGILIRLVVNAAALWVSTLILKGITVDETDTVKKIGTLLLVAAIFGIVNAVLRPIIKVFGCWAYILTLGLAALVVNGLLFMLTSWIAGQLDLPFHVDKFWPTAVLGALLVSVISWVLNLVVPDGDD